MSTTSITRRFVGPALTIILLSGLIIPHITVRAAEDTVTASESEDTQTSVDDDSSLPAISHLDAPSYLNVIPKNGNKIRL
ncbi:MAG: hypothetical protein IIZ22_05650, partial [Clostridia bacterium]|nr:hypothetical protein [Clostridia bacterium]